MAIVNCDRPRYLKEQLGLSWDPFISPVAEQEMMRATAAANKERPLPLAYFVPPTNIEGDKLLPVLRQARPAFIFGAPGMGKSSLRLALNATCRRVNDGTLVVNFQMRQRTAAASWTTYAGLMAADLAIDLCLQIFEQFKPSADGQSEQQITQLGQLVSVGGRPLRHLLRAIVAEPAPPGMMGEAQRWHKVGRLPVRHVARCDALVNLVRRVRQAASAVANTLDGATAWRIGLETAQVWGFKQFFVLIDGVDTWFRSPAEMFELIEPLLAQTAAWQTQKLFGKFFLPTELEAVVTAYRHQYPHLFPADPIDIDLQWDEDSLRELLAARFRAARARRTGFNDQVAPTWNIDLDRRLLEMADGSPRRLLQLVSMLIDKQVEMIAAVAATSDPFPEEELPLITKAVWQQTMAAWHMLHPRPAAMVPV